MSYELYFLPSALKEWQKLSPTIQSQFKKKLVERLANPRIAAHKLSGYDSVYKIKLRAVGYRLVYEVIDDKLLVYVIAVGKRSNNDIYKRVSQRI